MNQNILSLLIGAHITGDFLLQNHWMQAKSKSSFVCSVHVFCYAIPFLELAVLGLISLTLVAVILCQHWLQDRFSLHLKWMKTFRQSPPDKWPSGPLCIDQAFHIGFLWLLCLIVQQLSAH